ncbi:unnamed protein product, partial [Cyprideis torosa]
MKALMKPMRYPRDQEMHPDHFYFDDFERHNAEIASFHLDRILGFRRVPPTTGRLLNITSEIYSLAPLRLLKTFFISPADNLCFHGTCDYYCDTAHAFCGQPDMLEASVAVLLPSERIAPREELENPWKRTYNERDQAKWETGLSPICTHSACSRFSFVLFVRCPDDSYCDKVRKWPEFQDSRLLTDVMDMAIFDFLIGNQDRHHYEVFDMFEETDEYEYPKSVCPLHLDQGRAFGRPREDDLLILAPLTQCCQIRISTLQILLRFHQHSPHLSEAVDQATKSDPLYPLLLEKHLKALDRRLSIVLRTVRDCIQKKNVTSVIITDGF